AVSAGTAIELNDEDGTDLGIELTVKQKFSGVNRNGATATQISVIEKPENDSSDSFFGNEVEFSGQTSPLAELEISGLNPDKQYDFLFFGSREAGDNRETEYTVSGNNEEIAYLNTSSNTGMAAGVEKIKPSTDGTISIKVTFGPNNNNGNRFYYLNAMKISPSE